MKEEILKRHNEIFNQIEELKEQDKNLFKDYFKSIGIDKGTIFILNSSYSGEHKCLAWDPTHYRYITKKGKVNFRDNIKTLWAGNVTDEIQIEKQLTEDEFKEFIKD